MKIACPKCDYRPKASDRWMCLPGCRTVWNTFETRAKCPGCGKQWQDTACPACHLWSLHDDWYHDELTDGFDATESRELVEVS